MTDAERMREWLDKKRHPHLRNTEDLDKALAALEVAVTGLAKAECAKTPIAATEILVEILPAILAALEGK